jgi:predicted RND superfamily exporter protein
MKTKHNKAHRFFKHVLHNSAYYIGAAIAITIGMAIFLPKVKIDTSVEAFINPEHQSLVSRERVKEIFGLSDPIILAVENEGVKGIYNKKSLRLIQELTDSIQLIKGVDPERVVSLATENAIYGDEEGMIIKPFLEDIEDGDLIRESVENFPLYVGNLVSEDGTVSLIIIEVVDKQKYGSFVYAHLDKIASSYHGEENLYVAGEGAVVEHLGKYVQDDAKLMTPLAFLVITIVLFIAYRTWGGLLLSNMVVMGSLIIAMGIMIVTGVPFYLISNIIPVIIISISVADSIHIMGHYYELKARHSGWDKEQLTIETMAEMWRPVLVTSITNIVGFIAMGYSSDMPPMRAVGLYSSLGVVFALLFSLFVLPAVLARVNLKQSKAFKVSNKLANGSDIFGKIMASAGEFVLRYAWLTLSISGVIILLGIIGITKMELNDSMVEYFNPKERIYQADQMINKKLNGTNYFDIVVKTDQTEGLFDVDRLRKIEILQQFLEKQPHVKATTSIVDIIKQLNYSINGGEKTAYELPDSDDLIAQYLLLYSASSSSSDFEKYVDYDYRLANIRVMMDNGQYRYIKNVLKDTKDYLNSDFNEPGMTSEISGWLNVINYWIGNIKFSHFLGVILAFIVVWAISALSFKSAFAGILAVIPVMVAVFLNYAIMGFADIWLKVSTSITVAIAIGVAVDFSVHTIDRLLVLTHKKGYTIHKALINIYPNTGRALLFNLLALALGFGTNIVSAVPPWATFGLLVMTMVSVSFIASLTLLPVLIKVLNPGFLISRNTVQEELVNISKAA